MGRLIATDIDEKLLNEVLTDLEKSRSSTPRTIAKLESMIHPEDDLLSLGSIPFGSPMKRT